MRLSLVLCAILLAGCATPHGPGAHAGEAYVVNAPHALFYSYGPAQTTGPDFALSYGQRVTMMNYDYGYSRVALQGTGEAGYVPTEDLSPAPPAPAPSPAPRRRHTVDSSLLNGGGQQEVPLPEFPESEPPPGFPPFRY